MVEVKGNSGKAVRLKISTQLLGVVIVAVLVVAAIKTFGSGSWHAKAIMEDQQQQRQTEVVRSESNVKSANVADITVAKEANKDIQDKNLIQFVFSKLDGEEGQSGEVIVKLRPDWAPLGAQRVKDLTADSFWDECRVFRVVPKFMVQMGINGDPEMQKKWQHQNIADDPVNASNTRGTVSFAMAGKGTRTTQIFFNTVNNSRLDKENFSPFGEVISGMDIIDRIYAGYREKPDQGRIHLKGNAYLEKEFPKLSFIKSARFISSTEVS